MGIEDLDNPSRATTRARFKTLPERMLLYYRVVIMIKNNPQTYH